MNLTALDTRNTDARQRITIAAAVLGAALGVSAPAAPTAIEQRQPAVAHMRELEELAAFLEAIAQEIQPHAHEETRS